MKNIFCVFLSDAKRLSGNVVAIVIIMGLSIIPALYAWFNIMSNWDPYGEAATSQMKIAVYSEDEGVTYGGAALNVGDSVIEGLQSNTTIGWVFTDTKEEALEGVYSGEYYAALIVPESFSEDMVSFIGGSPKNPKIEYYENSKKNAIAAKITDKAKTAVQRQVNATFVSTMAEVLSTAGEVLTGQDADGGSLMDGVLTKLTDMETSLDTYVNILDAFTLVTASASDLVGSTQSLIPNMQGMAEGGQSSIAGMQEAILSGAATADTISSMMDISLDTIISSLDTLSGQISTLTLGSDFSSLSQNFQTTGRLTDTTLGILGDTLGTDNPDYSSALESYQKLEEDIQTLAADAALTQEKLDALKNSISGEIAACKTSLEKLKTTFDFQVVPNLDQSVSDVESALIQAQVLLGGVDGSFRDVDLALQSYGDTLEQGTGSIAETRDYVAGIRDGLRDLIDGLEAISGDEQYQQMADILTTDPKTIAEFAASPVVMETEPVYEIEIYGSAMAPFYTVLALWVGALILVALIHVKVEQEEEWKGIKPYQTYFGRYITFFLIGQAQTLITVLGDLFFVQIQCPHPFLFWLAGAVSSLVFTIFIYSLTVAFGNVGEAIAVVVMVIQVAGAGGTFPVEVLPQVYQAIYRFLPFTYCMNAMRECVGGLYQMDYLKDLAILGIYIVISLLIGLVLKKPFEGLNRKIEQSKEKSGLML